MSEYFDFIARNKEADAAKLRLKFAGKQSSFDVMSAILQIECRQKTVTKLPEFLKRPTLLFPSLAAAEQASHQAVAAYHASIAGNGHRIADLTASMGIDSMALMLAGNHVTAIELDHARATALSNNLFLFDPLCSNHTVVEGDSIKWLQEGVEHLRSENLEYSDKPFDILFIDPARRDETGKRSYFFRDSLPDIVGNWDILMRAANKVIIKASPILDLSQAKRELPAISEFHIVCVKGECKEVLCIAEATNATENPTVTAIDLLPDISVDEKGISAPGKISRIVADFSQLGNYDAPLAQLADLHPGTYIYDPNAAIHKIQAGSLLCRQFDWMKRLSASTDLYHSPELHKDFPGRIFQIDDLPDKARLKSLKGEKMEVISRNHPLTADNLRRKTGLRSGGDSFLIASRVGVNPITFIAECTKLG